MSSTNSRYCIQSLCSGCLTNTNLINLQTNDSEHIRLKNKLQFCVPSIEFTQPCFICVNCLPQLNISYEFINKCISSKKNHDEYMFQLTRTDNLNPTPSDDINNHDTYTEVNQENFNIINCDTIEDDVEIIDVTKNSPDNEPLEEKFNININESKSQCQACKVYFKDRCQYVSHFKVRVVKLSEQLTTIKFKCCSCVKLFSSRKIIFKHILKHADRNQLSDDSENSTTSVKINVGLFKCNLCPKEFRLKMHFDNHMQVHNRKNFAKKQTLKTKIYSLSRNHVCQFCSKVFRSRRGMMIHQKINCRKYLCAKCNKKFTRMQYRRHLTMHNKKSIQCRHCILAFRIRRNYENHLRTAHNRKTKRQQQNLKISEDKEPFFDSSDSSDVEITHEDLKQKIDDEIEQIFSSPEIETVARNDSENTNFETQSKQASRNNNTYTHNQVFTNKNIDKNQHISEMTHTEMPQNKPKQVFKSKAKSKMGQSSYKPAKNVPKNKVKEKISPQIFGRKNKKLLTTNSQTKLTETFVEKLEVDSPRNVAKPSEQNVLDNIVMNVENVENCTNSDIEQPPSKQPAVDISKNGLLKMTKKWFEERLKKCQDISGTIFQTQPLESEIELNLSKTEQQVKKNSTTGKILLGNKNPEPQKKLPIIMPKNTAINKPKLGENLDKQHLFQSKIRKQFYERKVGILTTGKKGAPTTKKNVVINVERNETKEYAPDWFVNLNFLTNNNAHLYLRDNNKPQTSQEKGKVRKKVTEQWFADDPNFESLIENDSEDDLDDLTLIRVKPQKKQENVEKKKDEDNTDEHIYCRYCKNNYQDRLQYMAHQKGTQNIKSKAISVYMCCVCPKLTFTEKSRFQSHLDNHDHHKIYSCIMCSNKYVKKAAFVDHINEHSKQQYQCLVCFHKFDSDRDLKLHILIHS